MTWYAPLLGAVVFQGVANIMYGKVSAVATPMTIGVYLVLSGAAVMLASAIMGHTLGLGMAGIRAAPMYFVCGVASMMIGNLFLTTTMATAPAGIGFSIFNVGLTLVGIMVAMLLGEKVSLLQGMGIVTALAGTYMMMKG
jgi:drug/metabolite transporter (DMT)-like permease